MPESMIATLTGARLGIVGQNDQASSWSRYHSWAAYGSVFANAAATAGARERRERDEEREPSHCTVNGADTPGADAVARCAPRTR